MSSLSLSLSLSQTLAALDEIPALLETIKEQAETTGTKARVALETMAVALEDGDDKEAKYEEPKEFTRYKSTRGSGDDGCCVRGWR